MQVPPPGVNQQIPPGSYNQHVGQQNQYNGGSNVTYAHGGGLQTTRQAPPATSGTMPSRQPATSSINGYNNQPNIGGSATGFYSPYNQPNQNAYGQQSHQLSQMNQMTGYPGHLPGPPMSGIKQGVRNSGPSGDGARNQPLNQQPLYNQQSTASGNLPVNQMQNMSISQSQYNPYSSSQSVSSMGPLSSQSAPNPNYSTRSTGPPSGPGSNWSGVGSGPGMTSLKGQGQFQQPPRSSGPGMPPSSPGMPPSGPGMPPSGPGMPPSGPSMPPSGPGMPLSGPGMPPSGPGMTLSGPGMPPSGPGMPPSGPGMPPSGPGMPPPGPGMPPSGPGMPPSGPGMPPSGPGMPPPGPGMPPPGPGMPPTSNQYQQQSFQNQGLSNYPTQQQPAPKRLDPDMIPSPIQVIELDKQTYHGQIYRTEGRGQLPPLVTTKYTVEDLGNASPRYIRCSSYNVSATADMLKTCQIPMSICVKPLSQLPPNEVPPLIVDPGPEGPIRCKRCKTYMCPQFGFIEGGRRFQCHMCNAITDTPHYYFDHIDHMNQRVDKYQRPELCRGSYEFITTKNYCKNDKEPLPPAYIFAIDVSYNAIKSGMVELLCRKVRNLLDTLPRDFGHEKSLIRVGFLTYNSVIHFYNLNKSLVQPQMMVVSDVNDIFVPLQDGFLVDLDESRHVIDSLLEQIPDMFRDTRETNLIFAPIIQAAVQALESCERAGKLFMFHSGLPSAEAPGKLKSRDDRKLIGTDKEKSLFSPACNFYEKLAKECVSAACCVDLFLFPNQYADVATLCQVPQITGGQMYKYNFFRVETDGERFINDLAYDLSRNIGFDAVMRVRTSTGIRPVDFLGSLYMSNTTDVELAAIDCDKAITVELKHDDKMSEDQGAHIQVALLYTSVGGQRRLRLHNLSLSVCNQLSDVYRCSETDAIINHIAKKSIRLGLQVANTKLREDLVSQFCTVLAVYRKDCTSPAPPGQLILPECIKLLPAYVNCLLKSDAIRSSHDVSTDDRSYLRHMLISKDVTTTQAFFYPTLIPVTSGQLMDDGLPIAIRCSQERMKDTEVYILENTINLFLWIGQSVNPDWINNVFGVPNIAQIDVDVGKLKEFDNEDSNHVRELISTLQSRRSQQMKFTIIRQRDKLEPFFKHFLVEDQGTSGASSYVDFLCHMHKEIRNLLR